MAMACHNLNLGLATKAKAWKGACQKGSPGVTSHVPGSVKKCEGLNLHIPKWAPTLGVGISMDSRIFRKWFQGSKPIRLRSSLYPWKKILECRCLKWACVTHLDTWNISYGQKKGHWKLGIAQISLRVGGLRHIIGKIYTKAITFLQTSSQSKVCTQSYGPPKS
jgi:hypothetical protein